MPQFQPTKANSSEIKKNESTVNPRQDRTKKMPSTLFPNELVIMNFEQVKNKEEIFNLIDNHVKPEEMTGPNKGKNSLIFYLLELRHTISLGHKLNSAFKKSKVAIKLSKVNKEVKVYVDFSEVK